MLQIVEAHLHEGATAAVATEATTKVRFVVAATTTIQIATEDPILAIPATIEIPVKAATIAGEASIPRIATEECYATTAINLDILRMLVRTETNRHIN